jgi:D-alanyl-D-alanine carboxypeptidase
MPGVVKPVKHHGYAMTSNHIAAIIMTFVFMAMALVWWWRRRRAGHCHDGDDCGGACCVSKKKSMSWWSTSGGKKSYKSFSMEAMYCQGSMSKHIEHRRFFRDGADPSTPSSGLSTDALAKVMAMYDRRANPIGPNASPIDPELFGALISQFSKMIEQYQVPGCIVSVQRGRSPPMERAIGFGNSARTEEMRTDNHFKAGSVTKTMTSVLMLLLIEQGHAKLDMTIDYWREAIPILKKVPRANEITILQMLNMTSGLADYESTKIFEDILGEDPEIRWNKLDLVRWAATKGKPEFSPGTKWKYCNTGYVIIGLIIEKITGMSLDKAMRIHLFDPLGMSDSTYLDLGIGLKKPHARGYGIMRDDVGFEDMTDWSSRWAYAAGAVVTTARDLIIWAKALGNGTILKQYRNPISMLNESAVPDSPAFQKDVFFYGLGIVYDHNWVWHNGSIPGFETVCAHFRPLDLSLVISINQTTLPRFAGKLSVVTRMFQEMTNIYTPGNVIGTRMP